MKATRLWVLASLPFALAACSGDGDAAEGGGTDTTTVAPSTETSSTTTPPAGADTGMSGAQAMGGAVTMNAVGNSGVTGQAQFMDHGQGQTMVTVNLAGQGSSAHSGHIHQGTCDALGSVVAPLQDVTLANGAGTSTSTVQVPLATVMNGQHVVAYHQGQGSNAGAPVVCAQIPAQQAGGTTSPAM
jgi:hypothetical protein